MNEIEKSRLIFETLSEIRPIETALVSMWPLNDKYSRAPFLRFRFEETEKDDMIYSVLKEVISSYSGRLKWAMVTKADVRNYLILPEFYVEYSSKNGSLKKQYLLSTFAEDEINNITDSAILDVEGLASHIRDYFQHHKELIR